MSLFNESLSMISKISAENSLTPEYSSLQRVRTASIQRQRGAILFPSLGRGRSSTFSWSSIKSSLEERKLNEPTESSEKYKFFQLNFK